MAEKRISVRLAAFGGKQVEAAFDGVGASGKRGLGQVSRQAEIARAKLAAFGRRAAAVSAAASAALIATGAAAIRSGLQTIDAQAKLAQSLGTTVASVQTLERAGELAGVAMGEIEQASKKLTTRLSEAAGGTGEAVDALKRLRLTATELQALPLDERIAAIQDALTKFVAPAQRAAVAGALFGDRSAISFSRIDTATLRQATADVRAFGVLVSEQDADQIERTNDAISRLGLAWRGFANQLAVAAAPALERAADALAQLSQQGSTLNGAFAAAIDAMTFLIKNIDLVTAAAGTLLAFMTTRWVAGMVIAGKAAIAAAGGVKALTLALAKNPVTIALVGISTLAGGYLLLRDNSDDATEAERLLNEQISKSPGLTTAAAAESDTLAAARRDQAQASLDAAEAELARLEAFNQVARATARGGEDALTQAIDRKIAGTAAQIAELRNAISGSGVVTDLGTINVPGASGASDDPPIKSDSKAAKSAKELTDAQKAADAIIKQVATDSVTYAQVVTELSAALNAGKITQEQFTATVALADEQFNKMSAGALLARDATSELFDSVRRGSFSASSALDLVIDRLFQIASNSALNALFGGQGGGGGGLFGSLLGALSGGGLAPASSPRPRPRLFAGGGDFGGGLRIVGELGPELEATGPSRIFSAAQTRGMLSGGHTTVRVELSPDLIARVIDRADRGATEIADRGISSFSKLRLPGDLQSVAGDPRRRGA